MTLLDANGHLAESLRLAGERWTELKALGFRGANAETDPWSDELREAKFRGWLWVRPGDEVVAIARWQEVPKAGPHAELHLASGYRSHAAVGSLLKGLEALPAPHAYRYDLPTVGRTAVELADLLEPLGFRHLVRYQMTFEPGRPIPEPRSAEGLRVRPVRASDETALVRLGTRAYADWPLDPGFFSPGMTVEEDQVRGFRDLFGGVYGPWMEGAATAVEADGVLVGATMVNDRNGPLITEVLADPAWRRKGVATAAILATLRALRAAGAPTPRLNVTAENHRARALYERLGFEVTPLGEDNSWIAFDRVGRPDLAAILPRIAAGPVPP